MLKTSATKAREHFPELVDKIRSEDEVVFIYKHKKPIVVWIDPKRYKFLEELEDAYWSNELKQAMKKGKLIGTKATAEWLDQVKAKLE